MRLTCPHCGERDSREFKYLGDASLAVSDGGYEAVYLRQNPSGEHAELWQHQLGCRAWLKVVRNISTHEVLSVNEAAL